jgi:hypothetical protein
MSNVFVIVNEWTNGGTTSSDLVDYKFFTSESDAWDGLALIAGSLGVSLTPDETSVYDPTPAVESDEYYIQELAEWKKD